MKRRIIGQTYTTGKLYCCSKYDIMLYKTIRDAERTGICFCNPGEGYEHILSSPQRRVAVIPASKPFLALSTCETSTILMVHFEDAVGYVNADNELLSDSVRKITK